MGLPTIAIADDHQMLSELLAEYIGKSGEFEVSFLAGNGKEFLDRLATLSRFPDICVLDISMPVLDGYGTLEQIKKRRPAAKVVMLSMFVTDFNIARSIKAGANGIFSKDRDASEFLDVLRNVYEGKTCIPPFSGMKEGNSKKNTIASSRDELTPKELEFLKLCCTPLCYNEIAEKMGIGERTADKYRDKLFRKLNVNTRTGLIMFAIKSGIVLIPPPDLD